MLDAGTVLKMMVAVHTDPLIDDYDSRKIYGTLLNVVVLEGSYGPEIKEETQDESDGTVQD